MQHIDRNVNEAKSYSLFQKAKNIYYTYLVKNYVFSQLNYTSVDSVDIKDKSVDSDILWLEE